MRLYVCMIAMMHLKSKDSLTRGKDRGVAIDMPNYFYILEHEKGLCLVDAGVDCTHGETPVPEGDPVSVLGKLGYTPDDVRYVIMTHMHIDHTLYMSKFPKATFITFPFVRHGLDDEIVDSIFLLVAFASCNMKTD